VRKLVCHRHAVETVDVASVSWRVVRVLKSIVYLLLLPLLLQLLLELLLLLGELVLQDLVVLCRILLDFCLSFEIEVRLYRAITDESLIGLWKLSALIYNHLYLVQICSKVFGGVRCIPPSGCFLYDQLQNPVVDHCLLIDLVVLLSEDGVVLRRFESKVAQQLEP
jgi:hypothetical protein